MCRFSKVVDKEDLKLVVNRFQVLCKEGELGAMDGTKFSNYNRSTLFERRLGNLNQRVPPKTFMTATFVVGTENTIIYACDTSSTKKHDITYVSDLVRQREDGAAKGRLAAIAADKGYDNEMVHLLVRKRLGAKLLAPRRGNPWTPTKHIGRHFRKIMRTRLGPKCTNMTLSYHMKGIMETVNSMVKKFLGSSL